MLGYLSGRVRGLLDRSNPLTFAEESPKSHRPEPEPHVTVIVATHDRPTRLLRCLQSLLHNDYPHYDVVVVDNAPSTDETGLLVANHFGDDPRITYLQENLPGLGRAHNTGMAAARGSIVAFTDDDVIVDAHWISHLVAAFDDQSVGCVTGRIAPLSLDSPAKQWLESYAGFSKGNERRTFDLNGHRPADILFPYTAGRFGSGANMAFRANVLHDIGGFDPALGVGSAAYGGDDLAAFFKVVTQGHRLVYEPAALVQHDHIGNEAELGDVMFRYGAGLTAYLTKTVLDQPTRILGLLARAPAGLWYGVSGRSERNSRRAVDHPAALRRRELLGMLAGPFAYIRSRRLARVAADRR